MLAPKYSDFFNGQLPDLTILNGNNQMPHAGMEFPQSLVFRVTDTNGTALSNAPVSVEVISGDMELRTVSGGSDYHALRLTTDTHGAVTLIGYADRYINDPNCLVRVLAASRERIAEADFEETLVPVPTISITSPVDGGSDLIGTNEPLTITVDAEPAPGASIREVDYSYQMDGWRQSTFGHLRSKSVFVQLDKQLMVDKCFCWPIYAVGCSRGQCRSAIGSSKCEFHNCFGLGRRRIAGLLAVTVFRPSGYGS